MDAVSRPADAPNPAELELLRARAYGPSADIAGDPVARARLEELEDARLALAGAPERASPAVPASAPERASVHQRASVHERASAAVPEPVAEPGAALRSTEAPIEGPTPAPERPWWRRRRWWAVAGAVAALGLAASAFSWVAPRAPDYVLHLVAQQPDEPPTRYIGGYLDGLGIDGGVHRYEEFRGFSVWSGTSRYGTECLLITHRQQGGTGGCSTDGLVPTVDLPRDQQWGGELFGDMPLGSLIRFQLEGDHVSVYLSSATEVGSAP